MRRQSGIPWLSTGNHLNLHSPETVETTKSFRVSDFNGNYLPVALHSDLLVLLIPRIRVSDVIGSVFFLISPSKISAVYRVIVQIGAANVVKNLSQNLTGLISPISATKRTSVSGNVISHQPFEISVKLSVSWNVRIIGGITICILTLKNILMPWIL